VVISIFAAYLSGCLLVPGTTVSVGADLSPKKLFAQPGFDTTIKLLTRLHIGTIFLDLGYSLLRVCDPKI